MSLSFHDVIADMIKPGSTVCVDPVDTQCRKPLC